MPDFHFRLFYSEAMKKKSNGKEIASQDLNPEIAVINVIF